VSIKRVTIIFSILILLTVGGIVATFTGPNFIQDPPTKPASGQVGGVDEYYNQTIIWTDCGSTGYKCATIKAPENWFSPSSGDIQLSLKMHIAQSSDKTFIVNPGGPGASGVDFVSSAVSILPDEITNEYNILSFDPRGVGQSTAIKCFNNNKEKDVFLYDTYFNLPKEYNKAVDTQKKVGQQCETLSGNLSKYVDTQSTARDLDLIRALTGQNLLNYIGYSYGTYIGEDYAALFPNSIGKVILDGVINPKLTLNEHSLSQAKGFSLAFTSFAKYCFSNSACPLKAAGNKDDIGAALNQTKEFLDKLSTKPLNTSTGRPLTDTAAFYGIITALYSKNSWGALVSALNQAIEKNDGTQLLSFADTYNDRQQNGNYTTNSTEANLVINCLDEKNKTTKEYEDAQIEKYKAATPAFYKFFIYPNIACEGFPTSNITTELDYSKQTNNKIILIGTTGDPATPYEEAVETRKLMPGSILLTNRGDSHTSYNSQNSCIKSAVDNYILNDKLPDDYLMCEN
jgi:pimeloyl-ACP methyl ester carboxylesterase